jgi:uncharacterized sulfatase
MISRREFMKLTGMGVVSLAMSGLSETPLFASGGSPSKPNILFVFSDQQRWDTLGCYGQSLNITPNLDRMASEGVRFEHAFTSQPVCGPTRATIQTGRYASETGNTHNDVPLPPGKWLAHRVAEAGYEVGYIGKWHLANTGTKPVPPELRGGYSDYWLASDILEFTSHGYNGHMFDADMNEVDFAGYRVDRLTDYALDYLRSRTGDRPFFLFLSFIEPHHQNDHNHFEGPIGSKQKYKDFQPPNDLLHSKVQGDWRTEFPDYLGCCNSIDYNLGRLRSELKALGLAENTLIIYTSDHACHFRTRNSEYKRSCHESSIRIPMIACGPGFTGGKAPEEMVSLIDIAPTILTAAGAKVPDDMRGRPLQPLACGKAGSWRQEIFVQISEDHTGRAIRTKKWKYEIAVPVGSPDKNVYCESHLYDLENDPSELYDLVDDTACADIRKQLLERILAKMKVIGEPEPKIVTRHAEV